MPSTRPPDRRCWRSQPCLAVACILTEAILSRELHTAGLLQPHASVGSGGRTPGQVLASTSFHRVSTATYATSVSHPRFFIKSEKASPVGRFASQSGRLRAGWAGVMVGYSRFWLAHVGPDPQKPQCDTTSWGGSAQGPHGDDLPTVGVAATWRGAEPSGE